MNYLPITGILLRHIRLIKNDMNKLFFVWYWPFLDILIWGFLGKWLQTVQISNNIEMILLLSILLWVVFGRIGTEVLMALSEELWSNNIINVFASPITLSQWIIGVILFALFLFIILTVFLISVIFLFYDIPILDLLKNVIIFAPSLLLSGICFSFLILSIVIYFGIRANEIAHAVMWSFMPFSGVFYPIASLPIWAQKISSWLPMTYVFTGMREYILNGVNPGSNLLKSIILSLVYGSLFLMLFFYMFNKSKNKGLGRLTD